MSPRACMSLYLRYMGNTQVTYRYSPIENPELHPVVMTHFFSRILLCILFTNSDFLPLHISALLCIHEKGSSRDCRRDEVNIVFEVRLISHWLAFVMFGD